MDIIVVSRDRKRTRRFVISPKSILIWLPASLCLGALLALAGTLGWAARGQQLVVAEVPESLMEAWEEKVASQKRELETAKAETLENTRAMSHRLAKLQAHVLRLDAAGGRMTQIAGLDDAEFNFSKDPPVGGPEVPESSFLPTGSDPILGSLDAFEQKLEARERQLRVLEDILLAGRQQRQSKPSGWPVVGGYISSVFGWRSDPFNGRRTRHNGIDFAAPSGSAVKVVAAGLVTKVERQSGYGLMVEVNHGNGYVTRYGHNRRALVKVGERVRNGQKIATVGTSGRSTGPHLHFEVELNGYVVNPAQYIQAAQ